MGIHPVMKWVSRLIPDPFFFHGRKSTNGLGDLGRRRVLKRLDSDTDRNDILSKLIKARADENGPLDAAQITELTAEAVTLL